MTHQFSTSLLQTRILTWFVSRLSFHCLQLTSQNPYCEDFIGKPHVYTVDINDKEEVSKAVYEILNAEQVSVLLLNDLN